MTNKYNPVCILYFISTCWSFIFYFINLLCDMCNFINLLSHISSYSDKCVCACLCVCVCVCVCPR